MNIVTPFVGVWIETSFAALSAAAFPSHPSWVCGLKLLFSAQRREVSRVTPFVGVWIETSSSGCTPSGSGCHTLRGCVD